MTRATTTAAIVFLLSCISLTVLSSRRGKSLLEGKVATVEETETAATETATEETVAEPNQAQEQQNE